MIIVTGATGALNGATVEHLLKIVPADQIGVSVRDVAKAQHLADRGVRVRRGSYDDPAANTLINNSVFGGSESAVKTEAAYLTRALPVFYLPDEDYLLAVSNKVGGPSDGWTAMTQQQWFPQYWYLTKS